MSNGAAAHAAYVANATKAFGPVIHMTPDDFDALVRQIEKPLVAYAEPSFFSPGHRYIMGHRGLFFYCKSPAPLMLSPAVDQIKCKRIGMPQ
jgi:hypothetical protein